MSRDAMTPLMQQYRDIKGRHQGAILFFRMGDFYEMFYDDAEVASRALGLTLTSRNNGGATEVPLAGVPVKAGSEYVRRLIQQGFRVAICEQVEDPKSAKGIVRREVIETITPGVAFSDDLLDRERNNFVCALSTDGDVVGIAAIDVSTGEFRLVIARAAEISAVMSRLAPRELLVRAGATWVPSNAPGALASGEGPLVTEREAWEFDAAVGRDELMRHFRVLSLDGMGVAPSDAPALGAAGALLRYVHELQPAGMSHIAHPVVERGGSAMLLDEMTIRNLELVESLRGADTSGTLLDVLDRTLTPMGARLLRQWILAPLVDREAIERRLDAIGAIAGNPTTRTLLRSALDGVRDLERLGTKAASGRATPRELGALGASLARLPTVRAHVEGASAEVFAPVLGAWDECADITSDISCTLVDAPPAVLGDEPAIRAGFDANLDQLRELRDGGKDAIARIQAEERARTGIQSLKVGFNRVFGYYIEISNANRHLVPTDYQRRQTLTGGERYVTQALKEYEERVLTAAEQIETRERALVDALRGRVGAEIARLQRMARTIATLDVYAALADVAERDGYVRPTMTDDFALDITGGRHPVVERMMPRERFIPNDLRLTDDGRLIILTGPNMAGKSTVLRQAGLIVLMAQMGSFVPATSAQIGIVDRVFTRVGASDNLVRGQSTFMVEMTETSAILHSATRRSLVLLDEIGRGTSTYDGVSIAWAVSEHLHDRIGCKTVFATHYHELTQLADELVAVRNYNVAVREVGDQILFLHRMQPGGADRSYGIEVGRLAGLPEGVLARARAVLQLLEGEHLVPALARGVVVRTPDTPPQQLALFAAEPHPLLAELADLDVERMTPVDALTVLARMAEAARRGGSGGVERPRGEPAAPRRRRTLADAPPHTPPS
jgi:DNA mismatch repair protein MutS